VTTPTGSWWGLHDVFQESKQEFDAFRSRPPVACALCGEPLRSGPSTRAGSDVQLYCPYEGWAWPRDYVAPTRLDPG
jgi:hypothetical protein